MAQIATGMMAVRLWKADASQLELTCGGLFVSLIPFVTGYHSFHGTLLAVALSQVFMIGALTLAARPSRLRLFSAVCLVVMGLASYQSCVLTFGVAWCGMAVMFLLEWDGGAHGFRKILGSLSPALLALFAGVALYGLSIAVFAGMGLIDPQSEYQFNTGQASLLVRLATVVKISFAHLWLTQPYLPRVVKLLLLAVVLGGGFCILRAAFLLPTRKGLRLSLTCLALLGLVLASKSQFLFSNYSGSYDFRFSIFGIAYVYLFCLLALLSARSFFWNRAGLLLFCCLMPAFAVNDLRAQEHQVHGNQHDFAVLNRVAARIEALENFDPEAGYILVQFGRSKPYIPEVYRTAYDVEGPEFFRSTVSQA